MSAAIRHVLLDIEGTTCPVSFVSSVLFPYASREVAGYLQRHGRDVEIQQLLMELQEAWTQEDDPHAQELLRRNSTAQVLAYIDWLIRNDRKLTAWKDLQGRIWREGYARGDLKAELFPEVARCLRSWKRQGLELSVYSSGSVPAQQLLYRHSTDGDLRGLFSHWFDTRIGLKQKQASYEAILTVIDCGAKEVLFLSDAVGELNAAQAAGMQVVFSDREGNPEREPGGHPVIQSLEDLDTMLASM